MLEINENVFEKGNWKFQKIKVKILDNQNISIKFPPFVNFMVWIK